MNIESRLIRPDDDILPAAGSLDGRIVLVTGAYGGLGRAVARSAARAGAIVVLLGRKARLIEPVYDTIVAEGGPEPAIFPLDLARASSEDFDALADTIQNEFGRLDGIVHAAAAFEGLKPLDQQKPAEWARVQQVGVNAPFLLGRSCLPLMRLSESASIVYVFDEPAVTSSAFRASYGVGKAALAALFAIQHDENEKGPIRIHGILPAPMRTALRRMGWFGEDTMQLPVPDAAGAAAAWLLGDQAQSMRGRVLDLRMLPNPA